MMKFDKDTNVITMIAKDTGDFIVNVENYTLNDGDEVYFTVNDRLEKPTALISKKVTVFNEDNTATIRLTSADSNLQPGTYYYDIQVNTADGRVDTVLGPAKFKILGGVKF